MKFDFWELEEHVGQLWDNIINRASSTSYPQAVVHLNDVKKSLGIIFRSMGGSLSSSIEASGASYHNARKGWLQRLSGKQDKVELCWQDSRSLYLPYKIDVFPDTDLNRKLYLWLTAISAMDDQRKLPWLQRNQRLTRQALERFPGLKRDYQKLLKAQLALRPDPSSLPDDEAIQESQIQIALNDSDAEIKLEPASRPPCPVYLWLHPSPPDENKTPVNHTATNDNIPARTKKDRECRKRQAENVADASESNKGLLAIRYENIFSWGDFVNLDRCGEEEDDLDTASDAARDMDTIHITQDERQTSSALKFDLDLPSAANDDLPMGEGKLLDEWNYKKSEYVKGYCCLQEMIAHNAEARELPDHLRKTARKLRSQFEAMLPDRVWYKAQPEGSELDVDAYLNFATERLRGQAEMSASIYKNLRNNHRDMACLLLADLSLSTDSWINNDARIIDIIRDSLYLFSESLSSSNDSLAIHGFSSRNRNHIRYSHIKGFTEDYNATVRGRIDAIKPGFYTRMGAAIRHASDQLDNQNNSQKLLLLLTDGKPNDLDIYEGRYGIEDTRMALIEARRRGHQVFCVTIDEEAGDYLPYLFGEGHYVVIRKVTELPSKLPLIYAQMTQ